MTVYFLVAVDWAIVQDWHQIRFDATTEVTPEFVRQEFDRALQDPVNGIPKSVISLSDVPRVLEDCGDDFEYLLCDIGLTNHPQGNHGTFVMHAMGPIDWDTGQCLWARIDLADGSLLQCDVRFCVL